MNIGAVKLFNLMEKKMAYLSEAHDVMSQNIANADTPGYVPKKLKKLDFEKLATIEANRLQMRATSPLHQASKQPDPQFRVEEQRKTWEKTPMDNKIALEEQMAQFSENSQDFQMVTTLYHKMAGLFRTAIDNRGA